MKNPGSGGKCEIVSVNKYIQTDMFPSKSGGRKFAFHKGKRNTRFVFSKHICSIHSFGFFVDPQVRNKHFHIFINSY